MPRHEVTGFRPGSKKWKKFMAKLYGWGAAIVILGALFKIQHYPGAGLMLVVGLSTEAVIFFFSAFEPLHEDLDWTLVYPELEGIGTMETSDQIEDKGSLTEQLDSMLEEAKIGPELIESLGVGLQGLSDQTSKLSDISDASVATEEFVSNIRGASEATGSVANSANQLSDTYARAAEQISQEVQGTTGGADAAEAYKQQLGNVTSKLQELNNVYELQLTSSNQSLENTNKLFSGIENLMQNLESSVNDTKKYKENMAVLANNLSSLNTVYGNMLTAMNMSPASANQPQAQHQDNSN